MKDSSQDIDDAFNEWLNSPYGEYSHIAEWIPKEMISICKQAFIEGFNYGKNI